MRARGLLGLVLLVLALSACGGGDDGGEATTRAAATSVERSGPALRVGIVTDVGGLDDRSFNFLANEGLERAEAELGIDGRVVVSRSQADYVPNLSRLARDDFDLVIAVGFLMADAVDAVAPQFPQVAFAIVDYAHDALKADHPNVRGLLFKEQEAGYLVGYLAGLVAREEAGSQQVIGAVGGQEIPPVDRYIAGFQAGAAAANPDITILKGYSQDFVDQAKCKEIALDQISRGASVVFQVAGQCGLGALSAAGEQNVRGIGVDADQGYLGPHILTSALKKVDEAVFQTIAAVQQGSFGGGTDTVFDVASGGVGMGKVAADVPGDLVAQVTRIQDEIASGAVVDIPETPTG